VNFAVARRMLRSMKKFDRARVGTWSTLAVLLVVVGCASHQGKGARPSDERKGARTPEEIEALFSREKDVPAAREAQGPSGAWTAEFPSDSEVAVTPGEGHTLAEFSLGTEAKTRCAFYDEAVDAGHTIGVVLDGVAKKGTIERVLPYRVATAQGLPVVFLEARYAIAAEGGKQAGSLKVAISPRLQTPVFCYLDEPGYAGAFEKAVTHVLTTLSTKEPSPEPAYAEVWAHSIDGQAIGFQWLQMLDEGAGKRTAVTISANFVPAGPGELSISDEVEVMKSDKSGVYEGTFYEVEDNEVAHDLTLKRSGKSKFTATGKVQGKDFKAEFSAPKLSDDIDSYRLVRQNSKKTTKLTSAEFAPSVDPSAAAGVAYAIDGKGRSVTIDVADLSLVGSLTEDGLISQVVAKMDEREVKTEIIHRAGKF
jgi:hypothetical protein